MSLTKTPTSMIDTTGATSGQVLTYNGSTSTWVASAAPNPTATTGGIVAWVNFNGVQNTGVLPLTAIRASYNISSITKHDVGEYTITFANALADAYYAPVISGNADITEKGQFVSIPRTTVPTNTSLRFFTQGTTAGGKDWEYIYVHVVR